MVERARCNTLFTDATEPPSSDAISAADQPITSDKINVARCRGGSCWMAATKARRTASRSSYRRSGPGAPSSIPSRSASG
jgi:hypothetical protein